MHAELDQGQMLHADSFNLADSMSALEMMDPKMDAGVINDKNKHVIPAGSVPSPRRSYAEVLCTFVST